MMRRQVAFGEKADMEMRGRTEGFVPRDPSASLPGLDLLPLSCCLQPDRVAVRSEAVSCYPPSTARTAGAVDSVAYDPIRKGLEAVGAAISVQMRSSNQTWPWTDSIVVPPATKQAPLQQLQPVNKDRNALRSVVGVKMKKAAKARRKVREPRFCFKTLSEVDVLDDGYKWRKYGQKVVKNTHHPRSYYRCTQDNCKVKKRVERLAEDPRMVITTYEGRHSHLPPEDGEESQAAPPPIIFFW